jgi:hypothetical protein
MPLGTPGTFVLLVVGALVVGFLIWNRLRRRTVALPESLTGGPLTSARTPEVDTDLRPLLDTDVHLDLGTGNLAPDPWT